MYYRELLQFAEQDNFRRFIDGFVGDSLAREYVQGVQVDIDRYWAESFLFRRLARRRFGDEYSLGESFIESSRHYHLFSDIIHFEYDELFSDDEYFKPPDWDNYCKNRGYPENANPIFIKFLLQQTGERRTRFETNQWEGHPLLYEYRAPCAGLHNFLPFLGVQQQLGVGSGIWSSGTQDSGTAGGFLADNQGKRYMLTCSHVAGPKGSEILYPAPGNFSNPSRIGEVIHSTTLSPKDGKRMCNSASLGNAPEVDLGLVLLDDWIQPNSLVPNFGNINHISSIANMGPYQPVLLNGCTSGTVKGELGPLNVWYEISMQNTPCCFSNLFEITPPRPYYFNSALVKGGDSGAWVVNDTAGMRGWDGMLIGCDGAHAFACFAENILKECDSALTGNLILI
jgi:hypothetical protein